MPDIRQMAAYKELREKGIQTPFKWATCAYLQALLAGVSRIFSRFLCCSKINIAVCIKRLLPVKLPIWTSRVLFYKVLPPTSDLSFTQMKIIHGVKVDILS